MKTESLDTNVLLRVAIESEDDQTARARALLARQDRLFSVSPVVVAEFVYVLMSHYGRSRAQAADVTRRVLGLESIVCSRDVILAALAAFESHPKLSFEDCLIAEQAGATDAVPLWTFDTKLAKQHPVARLVA